MLLPYSGQVFVQLKFYRSGNHRVRSDKTNCIISLLTTNHKMFKGKLGI